MAEVTTGIRSVLSAARVYSVAQRALGSGRGQARLVEQHIKPQRGERILDLGCGPAAILDLMPEVSYVGIDHNARYVEAARARHGHQGTFICGDILEPPADIGRDFDLVLAIGLLHHLDDSLCTDLLRFAATVLADRGRVITVDGTFVADQHPIARWLIARDRGQNVRAPEGYRALAAPWFQSVLLTVRHDVARVPYTHVIMECRDRG